MSERGMTAMNASTIKIPRAMSGTPSSPVLERHARDLRSAIEPARKARSGFRRDLRLESAFRPGRPPWCCGSALLPPADDRSVPQDRRREELCGSNRPVADIPDLIPYAVQLESCISSGQLVGYDRSSALGANHSRPPGQDCNAETRKASVRCNHAAGPARHLEVYRFFLGGPLSATAAFTSALNAPALTFSPSRMSIALRVLPSRLELKRRDGSWMLAP